MFLSKNGTVALPLRILLAAGTLVLTASTVTAPSMKNATKKKVLPDYIFENKNYRIHCFDKVKGTCERLLDLLNSTQEPAKKQ